MINDNEDPDWRVGHCCNFHIPQKETSSDAVVKHDSEMSDSQVHTVPRCTRLCSRKYKMTSHFLLTEVF